jgi:hypothetical protein
MKIPIILSDAVEGFMNLNFTLRIVVGLVAGALGSSSVIGFFGEYATYNYAIQNGFRLPAEGVPYLKISITIISLALFTISIFIFVGLFLLLRFLTRVAVNSIFKKEHVENLSELPFKKFFFVAAPGAAMATQPLVQILAQLPIYLNEKVNQWIFMSGWLIVFILIIALMRKPKWTKWILIIFFITSSSTVVALTFNHALYGKFLRAAKFGGGIKVMALRNTDKAGIDIKTEGFLLLRSSDVLILFDDKDNIIREIPLRTINSYEYSTRPDWKLPNKK